MGGRHVAWRRSSPPAPPQQRNRAGSLLTELHFAGPQRVGLLHADPHPGNYMLTDDGRLAVIDFGSVARLPDGAPPIIGRVTRLALAGRRSTC